MSLTFTYLNSSQKLDIGYIQFFRLRCEIASIMDKDFGEVYSHIPFCHKKEDVELNDKVINIIIKKKQLNKTYKDVIDFLYMCDCGGSVSYKTCKKLYGLLGKDSSIKHDKFLKNFLNLLNECYIKHRRMVWY